MEVPENFVHNQYVEQEHPNIIVPVVGISIENFSYFISFLTGAHRFSGEFVLNGNRVSLTLRQNDKIFKSPIYGSANNLDELLKKAAWDILEQQHPVILAVILNKKRKNNDAFIECIKAIQLKANDSFAYNRLGMILDDENKHNEAMLNYRRSIKFDPYYAAPHNNLGFDLYEKGNKNEAIFEYREAIKLDSYYSVPHNNLGMALYEGKKN